MPHVTRRQTTTASRFRRTREAHRDETAQDYAEAILSLCASRGEARVRDLAKMMGVSHVTVTRIVARLRRDGIASREPYGPVALTPKGRKLAEACRERHRVVLEFLLSLGVPPAQAEIDAEGIEHHVSQQTIAAFCRATQQPVSNAATKSS